jgi:uncharacterized LabA/DUF88 family protein
MSDEHYEVFVAVDSQNLYHACRGEYGRDSKLDFRKLKDVVLQQLGSFSPNLVVESIIYTVASSHKGNTSFVNMLQSIGYSTKTQYVSFDPGRQKTQGRKEWGVGIAVDVMERVLRARPIDRFVLVSGAGTFVPLLETLQKSYHIPTDVYGFRLSMAQSLSGVSARSFLLNKNVVWEDGR